MLPYILHLIPPHKVYTEAFFGGGAVFWAKQPVKTEIINDFNANVYTFYKVLQNRFAELKTLIERSVVSREAYKAALVIYHAPFAFTEVQQAWHFGTLLTAVTLTKLATAVSQPTARMCQPSTTKLPTSPTSTHCACKAYK